jgi:hypothetical protein
MITVVSCWYNEEDFAWLFLRHYGKFADKIVVLLDQDTNDKTLEVIRHFQDLDIDVKPLIMPNGLDDKLKRNQINAEYKRHQEGWILIADSDEFVIEPSCGMGAYLNNVKADAIRIDYIWMYQHKSEEPLNLYEPVLKQRKHGKRNGLERWKKPALVRAGKNIEWSYGHHEVSTNNFHDEMLLGVHWSMADVNLAMKRRINNHRNRMSEENKRAGLSVHNYTITEEKIKDICNQHNDCPRVFY